MPGLSRFSRKQPLSQESNTTATATIGGKDATAPPASAGKGDGGAPPSAVAPTNGSNAKVEQSNGDDAAGGDNNTATNFSTSLGERPSTGGSNTFADFGNMFAMEEHDGVNSNMMLDSTFMSSNPTEGGMGDGGTVNNNNNMMGDNSFMQGFGSRPSTGEGGGIDFQFGGMMNGFDSEGGDVAEQQPTTAKDGNGTSSAEAKRPADAPSGGGGGVGIGLFAKRRAVNATSATATSNLPKKPDKVKTIPAPPKNDGLASTASSVANLSQFDTNLVSDKNENEISSSENVQIPKSIATSGGEVEDDLTVGTTTSVAVAALDGAGNVAPPAPALPAKSPYFPAPVNQSNIQPTTACNEAPESSPNKEEIVIPGMDASAEEKSGEDTTADVVAETTKQGGVFIGNSIPSQRVSLSPPGTKVDENSIVIPGVATNNDNVNVAQTMLSLQGATNEKTRSSSTATTSVLNNSSRGIGRFNSTDKVKFALPESTTKTFGRKGTSNMNVVNTTAITPDHRNGAKQTSFARPSTSIGNIQDKAVTPTPHKTAQYDPASVTPGMPTAEKHGEASNEANAMSPTPATKNDVSTPKASNLNTYSGSSMLTTHESFDELLSQLGADLTEATDIHNKGNLDLLHLEVTLTHAYAKALQLKSQFVDLLDETDAIAAMGEAILTDL